MIKNLIFFKMLYVTCYKKDPLFLLCVRKTTSEIMVICKPVSKNNINYFLKVS